MTKFILHGGFTRKENELNRSFFEEFVRDIPDDGNVLMVLFASREADPITAFNELSKRMESEAGNRRLNFSFATEEGFLDEIQKADAIYMHGGSTNKLLRVLRTYPPLDAFMKGKIVAGSSAGAYAIGAYGASHSEDAMREGLGLLPVRIVCHYESPDLPPAPGAVAVLEHTATNLELVLLKDCEWRVFMH